ncbi:MAG: thiamine pyrophosphate-dependent enzyme, partial [Kiloniellaceae bacterium]
TAQTEKPGVAVIELPEDVAEKSIDAAPMVVTKTRRAAADHKAIAQAVDLIAQSKDPIILAGNGAVRKRAAKQLRRLAHKVGIGVVNTFMSKGAVARSDEHCLFTIGLQSRDYINLAMDKADLVIAVGYDLVEYGPAFWNHGAKKILHIDFEPAEVDQDYNVTVDVVSDIADALWQINEEMNRRYEDKLPLFDIKGRAPLRQAMLDDFAAEKDDPGFPVKPQRALWDVRKVMGPSDIVLSDVGAHKMWVARYYQCDEPNTCLISNGFCSMGFALPGAIGAKIAHPDRNVLAICGDAGFLMNIQDIETAARLKIPITIMVWCDNEYGLIKWKQQNAFDGRHSDLAFNNPDFEYQAKAFGIWGRTIDGPDQIEDALNEAIRQEGPALIAVPIDYGENMKLSKRLGNLVAAI